MSEARWVLELLGGDGRTVELPPSGSLVIGSARERAGFVVEGQGVDDAHCAIGRTREGDWAIKDLGSRYGTLLNGQKVAAARLKLGDQIVLGSRRLEVRAAAAQAAVQGVGSARPLDVPQRIGGYRIERLIGKGGMGAVYLAVQESLRRPVALKVLAPKLAADRDFVHRFQAEARAAAALSHPNVVVVYDVGEEGGSHYLSMEFMAGGSLEQKLAASGPIPWKAVLAILTDAAAGLAYAESRGIVHRDIKPANLMYSGTGTVKIADLGLATTLEQEANEAPLFAEGGRKVYGTPHFISPEQARGEAVDHRSDLYSLGATAYRLLSGHTPFEGASTREILRALQSEEPQPLKELAPELPAELDALVTRLMAKDPAGRFPTAEALRRECERLRLVAEHGPALVTSAGPGARRGIGVALLLVVLAAAGAWYLLRPGPLPAHSPEHSARGNGDEPVLPAEDGSFFDGGPSSAGAPDEEQALREREREAGAALRELPPYLSPEERGAALQGLRERFPGTEAARAAQAELDALRELPEADAPAPALGLEAALEELRAAVEGPDAEGERRPLAEALALVEGYRPPPGLGKEFEARRTAYAGHLVQAAEAAVKERFEQATRLALDGQFDVLRAHLADTQALFAGLDEIPGDPARLAGMRALREDLRARIERVDEEQRFFLENVQRKRRAAVGAALGPASGLLAELEAMDLEALEQRVTALPAELCAEPACAALAREVPLARAALETLRREFTGGGWRRKALVDPRSRKVREVRDVHADALVFDREGALESVPWREARGDPEWWHQLFQARLARDWSAEEARGIAALQRLVGAARGAALAREMIDGRGRGLLQPAELEALAGSFDLALSWLTDGNGALAGTRAELERERAAAARLAQALAAAQGRSWTSATAHLERLLAENTDTLLVGLLSDGGDWRPEPPGPAPK